MNTNRKKQVGLLLIVVVIAGLLAFATGSDIARADTPIVPPDGILGGKTYADWAAEWWQWAASVPAGDYHPLFADHKMDCGPGQEGNVWFLGGTYAESGKAHRKCEVPAGKALFFPIVNVICSPFTGDDPNALLECAENPPVPEGFEFQMNPLSAKIDNVPVEDLKDYYTLSEETFMLGPLPGPLPEDNIFYNPDHPEWGAVPGAVAPGATSGYFILLHPLPAGKHKITFSGEIVVLDPDGNPVYEFTTTIMYHLNVVGASGS